MQNQFNITFTDRQVISLEDMAKELDTDMAGVLKAGMSLLIVYLREQENGNEFAIVKDGKIVKEIVGLERT